MNLGHAFAELRPAMFALAYRITGNRADADEVVQDAFVRLHGATPEDGLRSLRAYLTTITARLSLNRLRERRARREAYLGEWLPEPLLTGDDPGMRADDISFALLVLLERLSPQERVVFVLRSAFDLPFEEIEPVVQRDAATCRKIFSRARAYLTAARPRFAVDRERHRALLRSFSEATQLGDTARLVSLLAADVALHGDGGGKAIAINKPLIGSVAVAKFVIAIMRTLPPGAELDEVDLNGTPSLLITVGGRTAVAVMIDTDGERIRTVFAVSNPDKLAAVASGKPKPATAAGSWS